MQRNSAARGARWGSPSGLCPLGLPQRKRKADKSCAIKTGQFYLLLTQEGELVGGPITDIHGNMECTFERYAAGVCIWVTVSLYKKENRWMIYVTKIEKRP